MLPSLTVCKKGLRSFHQKHPTSTFDVFWKYRTQVEKTSSILDDAHLQQTVELLYSNPINNGNWRLTRTGVPTRSGVKQILLRIRHDYDSVRGVHLGSGRIKRFRKHVANLYAGLSGTSHTYYTQPNEFGEFYIVGTSKVLMFLWGQTPSFDSIVIDNFSLWMHSPKPYQLPHLWTGTNKYTPEQYCDILEELDSWVVKWNQRYKKFGQRFQTLVPGIPAGRVIDIIYWIQA